jgi:hypothetical protein
MTTKKATSTNGSAKPSIHDKLTILKHLAGGRDTDMVAAAMKMTRYQVIDIASCHGYPDPVKMAKAVTLITQRLDAETDPDHVERQRRVDEALHSDEMEGLTTTAATDLDMTAYVDGAITSDQLVDRTRARYGLDGEEKTDQPARRPKPPTAATPASTNPPTAATPASTNPPTPVEPAPTTEATADSDLEPAPGPLTKPDEIRVLLNTAKTLTSSRRIERQMEKVLNEIARLRELVTAEQAKAEAAAAEKAERAAERQAARVEIQRLEEQLRQAKARLRGATPPKTAPAAASTSRPTVAGDPSAKEIRAWARQQPDLTCPATGRIPATVRTAYDAAHQTAAA